jgi:hypothetical protein
VSVLSCILGGPCLKALWFAPPTTRQVLNTGDLARLLWGLAIMQQYHSQLYRNLAFRAERLPEALPHQPQVRRLLREATVLHSCEHRLDVVAATAASSLLPTRAGGERQQQGQQQGRRRQAESSDHRLEEAGEAGGMWENAGPLGPSVLSSAGSDESGSSGKGIGFQPPQPRELRAAAESACTALQRAGLQASLRQLAFGDFVVTFALGATNSRSSSEKPDGDGGRQPGRGGPRLAAVLPATARGRVAVNAPTQLLGTALVSYRVLTVRGTPLAVFRGDEAQLAADCRALLAQHCSH